MLSLRLEGEEAKFCSERFAGRRFTEMRTLSAQVETDIEWLARMIPPPLEPIGSAVRVVTGYWKDEVVGAHAGGGLYVPARFGNLSGEFVLRLYVDSDLSVMVGREVFGEPKLLAHEAAVNKEDGACHGYVSRGVTRIAITGHVDGLQPPVAATRRSFNLKAHVNVDASSLFGTALLTVTDWGQPAGRMAVGVGRVDLQGALDERGMPRKQLEPCPITWSQGAVEGRTRVLSTVTDDHALPFVLGKLGLND